ncbi:MAG TPA: hemolysin family protein [Vicinamibacterales bacterium]|nr:hemolysin family protein [Vicinamibacterales bacterium]
MIELAILAAFILVNAFFVAAEFAIVGAPRAAIDRRAAEGQGLAQAVQLILKDPVRQDRYIATSQLGITVASLGLGMYGERVLAEAVYDAIGSAGLPAWAVSHAAASVVAIAVLTYFHIVVGEMVPKSIALQSAERLALWITPVMRWLTLLVLPVVIVLNGVGNAILHVLGITRKSADDDHYTPEELQLVVAESEEMGALHGESGAVLQELFEFGALTAAETMTPRVRVTAIQINSTADEVRDVVRSAPHTRYVVIDGDLDHVVGNVHIKDVFRLLLKGGSLTAAGVRPTPAVPATVLLDDVLTTMRRERAQMVVVVDEHGGTSGIVTVEDLFEEVAGEIDEKPGARPRLWRDDDGRLRVPGTLRVTELGEEFDLTLEHADVDSVSGLVLALVGRPAAVGDVVKYDRLELTVTAVVGRGVGECAVRRLPDPPGA